MPMACTGSRIGVEIRFALGDFMANKAPSTVPKIKYPALFTCADEASNGQQKLYLDSIRAEYAALLVAAMLTLPFADKTWYYALHAAALISGLGILIWRSSAKPVEVWYRHRALAESVKTSTWRYVMRAPPFDNSDANLAKDEFRTYLTKLLKMNSDSGALVSGVEAAGKHTNNEMEAVRALVWKKRRDYYLRERIEEQLDWYMRKASFNRGRAKLWRNIAIVSYVLAVGAVLVRMAEPTVMAIWPIEPLLVAAAAVMGWTQLKKFSELSSVYALTALEVQLIHEKIKEVDKEAELPLFVNEAEQAFSREHTQWVARQAHKFEG
jgi:SMODS and SLOG-associating 2TM effector domain 3/SMODS and SLOG-associating 2TM effector domain 1